MTEWFNNPVIVVAVLGVAGLIFAAGQWVGRINSHVSGVSALLKEICFDVQMKSVRAVLDAECVGFYAGASGWFIFEALRYLTSMPPSRAVPRFLP